MNKPFFATIGLLSLAIVACTPTPTSTSTISSVGLTSSVVNVRQGGFINLQGSIQGDGNFNSTLTWTLEPSGVGSLSSSTGSSVTYNAPSSTFGRVVRIIVSSFQDPSKTKTIYIGVHPNQGSIAAGSGHSMAIKTNGTLLTWGWNSKGQLGDGTINDSSSLLAISGVTDVVAVAAGYEHSLALKADGTMLAWGADNFGQLGNDAAKANKSTPVVVSGATGIVAIAASLQSSFALKSDGTLLAWGQNTNGQLGIGAVFGDKTTPVQVPGISDVIAIASSSLSSHVLALKVDGTMLAWGRETAGELGDDQTSTSQAEPVPVLNATNIIAVATGALYSLALKADGTVLSWGNNGSGQLGNGSVLTDEFTPKAVPNVSGVVAITAGLYTSLVLKQDGTMLAWGYDAYGQLGDDAAFADKASPVVVSGVTGVVGIASSYHVLALKSDGTMQAWGANDTGQLGSGSGPDVGLPQTVLLGADRIRVP